MTASTKQKNTCTVDGCGIEVRARNLCHKHYYRMKRTGTTEDRKVFHGHSKKDARTPTYRSWRSMRARCKYECVDRFAQYGGRGIKVCERWDNSFENFLNDMGERPEGHTLDRIDVNKDYEPGNCRWANIATQSNNKRCNRVITIYGKSMTVKQWHAVVAHETRPRTLYSRLDAGWTPKEAVFGRASNVCG